MRKSLDTTSRKSCKFNDFSGFWPEACQAKNDWPKLADARNFGVFRVVNSGALRLWQSNRMCLEISVQVGISAIGDDGGIERRTSHSGHLQQNLKVGKFVHMQLLLEVGQLIFRQ